MYLKLIIRALVVCCACAIYTIPGFAQSSVLSQPSKSIVGIGEPAYLLGDDPVIISTANSSARVSSEKPGTVMLSSSSVALAKLQPTLFAAIEQRLGARYHWGSEGPNVYDCSGFVWSSFQAVGINFERTSARTLWSTFEAPAPGEEFKFGTLVFFTHQKHVGIVADEHGFYHASRHHGVVYAPFNEYWLKRIDGYRRVPLSASPVPAPAIAATSSVVQPQHVVAKN
jgi:cell wall-associated NlpC family hydrolase